MLQAVNHYLESVDLRGAFLFLGLAGFFLSFYVAQQAWQNKFDTCGNDWIKLPRRIAHVGQGLCMLWLLTYANDTGWQPWPPLILLLFFVDAMMLMRAFSLHGLSPSQLFRRICSDLPQPLFFRSGHAGTPLEHPRRRFYLF